jgi:hypothetical protein
MATVQELALQIDQLRTEQRPLENEQKIIANRRFELGLRLSEIEREQGRALTIEEAQATIPEFNRLRAEDRALAEQDARISARVVELQRQINRNLEEINSRDQPRPQPQPDANQLEFVLDPVTEELIPSDSVQAAEIRAEQNRVQTRAPAPVDLRNWRIEQNDGTGPGDPGSFFVVDQNGEIFRLNIPTRDEAESALREAQTFEGGGVTVTPVTDVRNVTAQNDEANSQQATLDALRAQAAINERRQQANQGDWRVRLRLAPLAKYLYKADNPGILEPLRVTDGVIFPYTPKIDLSYRAMYDTASLTHANYNSYFYKSSMLDPVNITATFTAQDTAEANYLLAVIHFFRSATKMFYGQDAERGAPPPLVFFTGLGEYQFAEHPCVIHQFNYSLPSDVDYIRARSIMDPGTDLQNRRIRSSVATSPLDYTIKRLRSLGQAIGVGAENKPPAPPTLGRASPTYVPTRIDISLILYPIQSRSQVSNQFSLQQYANGDLLKGGFW